MLGWLPDRIKRAARGRINFVLRCAQYAKNTTPPSLPNRTSACILNPYYLFHHVDQWLLAQQQDSRCVAGSESPALLRVGTT